MKKVITYGTFDMFHIGHQRLLERAKALGDYLIVGVTSEGFDRERGKLNVRDSLAGRIESVRQTGLADEILVEEYQGQKLSDVVKHGVQVFAIGSDWEGKFDYLGKYCEVVYLERTKGVSSTDLREVKGRILRVGILTDAADDADLIAEANFVSGVEVTGVYAGDAAVREDFQNRYDLQKVFPDAPALCGENDLIFVHLRRRDRFQAAMAALEAGKHVIVDFPFNKPEEAQAVFDLSQKKGLALIERVPLAYLSTFHQLIWMLHGGAIGQILSAECALPAQGSFRDAEALAAFAVTRILGSEPAEVRRLALRARTRQDKVIFSYPDAAAVCTVSDSAWLTPGMTILGTDGRVDVPGAWWNMNYFRIFEGECAQPRRYSFNTEGPGLRYLLAEAVKAIAEGRTESGVLTPEKSLRLMDVLARGDLL
ncbi:MAG: adenylyltransferase/cytidyltransferase family protein [Clostridiales Family XIII bacterium]|jgi:glycerol-3-phosphate cytidylyltransferase|nr:adenylyltransferase/cytidyltransferase family protein [Clostridiales Family XIII bacterium]